MPVGVVGGIVSVTVAAAFGSMAAAVRLAGMMTATSASCTARGRIFSVTEKFFTEVVGDGQHTLEELILLHPRAVGWDWIGINLDDGGASEIVHDRPRLERCRHHDHAQLAAHLDLPQEAIEAGLQELVRRGVVRL